MQYVLIDDIAKHNEILSSKIIKASEKNGWPCHIALTTTNPEDVLHYAKDCRQPTVYFMDIELDQKKNTLSLYQFIQRQPHESYIIYVSAHAQYAMECLHTHAFDFLLKPLTDEQISDCLSVLWRIYTNKSPEKTLQVHMGSQTILLPSRKILYFSRDRMSIQAHMEDGNVFTWRESFDHLLPRLEEHVFCLCHRSFVVNLHQVAHIDWQENTLLMRNQQSLPISRRRITALKAALKAMEEA